MVPDPVVHDFIQHKISRKASPVGAPVVATTSSWLHSIRLWPRLA